MRFLEKFKEKYFSKIGHFGPKLAIFDQKFTKMAKKRHLFKLRETSVHAKNRNRPTGAFGEKLAHTTDRERERERER